MDRENAVFSLDGDDWTLTGWYRHQWRIGQSMELGAKIHPVVPAIPATVPGAVQNDLMKAGWLPDHNVGLKSLEIEWVNNRDWIYRKRFALPEGWLRDRCVLAFDGLDEKGEIYFNGVKLADFEGMFEPLRLDITALLRESGENELVVVFVPCEEVDGQFGYSNRIRKLKSRFNYGWDWCPRIVQTGIWQEVYLHTFHDATISEFFPHAELTQSLDEGEVRFSVKTEVLRKGRYTLVCRVEDEQGQFVAGHETSVELHGGICELEQKVALPAVRLWWPAGMGDQPLYRTFVSLMDAEGALCDCAVKHIGFRHVAFVPNPGAPGNALPYTLIVNGRRLFMKGINWVPISPFYGALRAEDYAHQLGQMKKMNVNLVRVWGGAINEKIAFYDWCDRNGLLVWQEFLQSSSGINNCPPEDDPFLERLEPVSRTMVRARRHHPCHIVWCGGNELMWDDYVPVTVRHRNIALLARIVREEDPGKAFLPASASGPVFCDQEADFGKGLHHDVHGPWEYLGDIDHYRFFNNNDALLRTESGTPGMSRHELVVGLADGREVWPPTTDNPYWLHRGSFWIQWDQLSRLFGPWSREREALRAYAQASRYLQMESLRYMAEATRRREPEASGFVVWMGNEPFANNANTSLLEYDGVPKPAYYAVKKAFGALHVTAKYDKIAWRSGERFGCELFVMDEQAAHMAYSLRARLYRADGELLREQLFELSGAEPAACAGRLQYDIADAPFAVLLLRLELFGRGEEAPAATNSYLFTVDADYPFSPLRALPSADIVVSPGLKTGQLTVSNPSDVLAAGVFAIPKRPAGAAYPLDNYLFLLPGERADLVFAEHVVPEQYYFEGINVRV